MEPSPRHAGGKQFWGLTPSVPYRFPFSRPSGTLDAGANIECYQNLCMAIDLIMIRSSLASSQLF